MTAIRVDVLGRSTDLDRTTLLAGGLIHRVPVIADLDGEHPASMARDRGTTAKRRLVVTLGAERWRQKGTEMAAVLNKNPDVIGWWAGEGVRRCMEDEEFATEPDRLDRELSELLARSER